LGHWKDDERFDKNGRLTTGLGPRARELKAEYEAGFTRQPAAEVVAKVREFGGFASAYLTHEELMHEPQVAALEIIRQVPASDGADVPTLAFPVKFSQTTTRLRGLAPQLGEHTDALTQALAASAGVWPAAAQDVSPPRSAA